MEEDNKTILLITKCLANEATAEEFGELQKWVECSKENKLAFQKYKNIWNNSGISNLEKMIDVEKSFNLIKKRVDFKSSSVNLWQFWKNVAAVLLIPIIAGNTMYFILRSDHSISDHSVSLPEPVYNEIFVAFGTRSAITLSDGSSLWLNSGSSLRYPDRFFSNNRTVYLNGEAYFEVKSDPQRPFIVETSSVKVTATGTKFNVSEYNTSEEAEVTLVSGKVEVDMTDVNNNINKTELAANQHLLFNKSDGISIIENGETYRYISWKDGKLIFRDELLVNFAKKIEKIFNVDIELQGQKIQNFSFRATFEEESLEEILKLLKLSSPIDYIEVRRKPLPDSTFSRKKVILFEKRK